MMEIQMICLAFPQAFAKRNNNSQELKFQTVYTYNVSSSDG